MERSSSRYSIVPGFIRDRMREKKRREQEAASEEIRRSADEPAPSRYSDEERRAVEEMSGEGYAKGGMVKKYAKGGMAGCGPKKYAKGGMVTKVKPPGGRGTKACKIC